LCKPASTLDVEKIDDGIWNVYFGPLKLALTVHSELPWTRMRDVPSTAAANRRFI